jgi:aminopeptidase N
LPIRLLIAAVWLALACAARAQDAAFDVLSYDVRLTPDFAAATVRGEETIRFRSGEDGLGALSFSANALKVFASIDGEAMVESEIEGDRRVFHLPRAMRKGEVGHLLVSFSGAAAKGLVFAGHTVRSTYFTCDFMICEQDRPGDKALVTFALTLPTGTDAVAPGDFVGVTEMGHGLQRRQWRSGTPTSAYLLGFAAGDYRRVALDDRRPALYVLASETEPSRVRAMFADTRRMLEFFETKSGVPFDKPAYGQVLVAGSEAQEAAAHATIGLEEIAPILDQPQEDWVIAHELAHQWWGNAVTCADWRELWLNEGLTVFMVAAYKEARWGRPAYERELELAHKRWGAARAQGFDVPLSWTGSYPSLKLKRAMAYAKAVVFLDTLRRELGEDAFWRGIKAYTRDNWNGTVTARDFERAMEVASKRDLSALFETWVFGR